MSGIGTGEIDFFLSGGAANADPNLSFGGAKSTTALGFQTLSAISAAGVTAVFAHNATSGALNYVAASSTLQWHPTGGTAGAAISLGADGDVDLLGINADGSRSMIRVNVVLASLGGSDSNEFLTATANPGALFDNVSKLESADGAVEYRCVYIVNNGTAARSEVKLWIEAQPPGADSIDIALDAAGINGVAAAPADAYTAPAGAVFSAPSTSGAALNIGTLNAGDFIAVHIRRTTPASTTTPTLQDGFQLAISAKF